ncbi:hypothetical protein LRD69_16890 [Streptomyces sp. JH14]|uniref:hypothetical protein n=1 Tax=Streptomyces sp. JH14 TaxID=2793630 RepID=UPI0023F79B22|nr:hypothetical protein [Streptomyces sp. JH14]MDF6043777.1 hypothetical protein [Streptomyces sp. JH14]
MSGTPSRKHRDRRALIRERKAAASLAVHQAPKATGTSVDAPDALVAATVPADGWTVAGRHTKHLRRTGAAVINPGDFNP